MDTKKVTRGYESSALIDMFDSWFQEVMGLENVREPTAMVLATSSASGCPSARVVLLKRYSERGFEFFTNLRSRKALEIRDNPKVALVFDWHYIQKQVRIEGTAEFMNDLESDEYYASRPRGSQIGAWASRQSAVLEDMADLVSEVERFTRQFEGKSIPRPGHWGGIIVVPRVIEFWQEGNHRLHVRDRYSKNSLGLWDHVKLYP